MIDDATIRQPCSKPKKPHCVQCGSSVDVERHHVGGQNHVAWFTTPLCQFHHRHLTDAVRQADVNLRYTPNKKVRLVRALMSTVMFLWMLLKELLQELEQEGNKK